MGLISAPASISPIVTSAPIPHVSTTAFFLVKYDLFIFWLF